MTAFYDYMDTVVQPVAEYKFDEASGNLANTGSGTMGDLEAVGTPVYRQPGYAFEDSLVPDDPTYQIDFDGTTEQFHTKNITAIQSLTEGAIIVMYSPDTVHTTNLVIIQDEADPITELLQIALIATDEGCRLQFLSGANSRNIEFATRISGTGWSPNVQTSDVTHMLIFQYDVTEDEYQVWLDGHRLSGQIEEVETVDTTGGSPGWIADMVAPGVLSVGGLATYSGGSYTGGANFFDGQVEYVAFTDAPLSMSNIREMWKRWIGGIERAESNTTVARRYVRRNVRAVTTEGPPAGLDKVTFLTARANLSGTAFPNPMLLERCNQRWVAKGHWVNNVYGGHCYPIDHGVESEVDNNLNAITMSQNGFNVALWDSNVSTARQMAALGKGAFWRRGAVSPGGSRAVYLIGSTNWSPDSISDTGVGRNELYIHPIAVSTISTTFFPAFRWDYLSGTAGNWQQETNTIYDQPPTREGLGESSAVQWSENGNYLGIASKSTNLDDPNTGGAGGIHIYATAGLGTATPTLTRQTLSGYTANGNSVRTIAFFNDGTTDYAIVAIEGTNSGGMSNAVDNVAIFKRSGSTWTATANLYNNGVSTLPGGGRDYIRTLYCIGDDLYVHYWRTGAGPLTSGRAMDHLRWNGTYFALQGEVENPYETIESPANLQTVVVNMYFTDDGKGVITGWGGTTSTNVLTTNLIGYDRDPDTGVLTLRDDWVSGKIRGPDILTDAAADGWNFINGAVMGATELEPEDYPDGRDGQ